MQDGSERVNATTTRLGGFIDLDGSASWAPALAGQVQPVNCYLVDKGDRTLLIDTGVAAHRTAILAQLAPRFPHIQNLTVCLTRSELECVGNIGVIHQARPIDELVRGPLNPFDDVADGSGVKKVTAFPVGTFDNVMIGDPPFLEVIPPKVRILTTYWLYDPQARTLYSSDLFGHTAMVSAETPVVIRSLAEDDTDYASARAHLLAKYWWLPKARTRPMRQWLVDLFESRPIDVIAPTHGRVLHGHAVVQKHLELMLHILSDESIDR